MTDHEIRMIGVGGAEELSVAPHQPLIPVVDEIRIRHKAIGVNFIDIYHRLGLYPLSEMPAILGVEGAGVIEAVGSNVRSVKPGDRVAYVGLPVGAYSATRLLPAERAIVLPEDIVTTLAAATMLRGITAYMLLHEDYKVQAGTVVLIHSAAGGLGTILVRWAKLLGAVVVGTVSSSAKAEIAYSNGADLVIIGRDADLVKQVSSFTGGLGVDVAYDGIGGITLIKTMRCTRIAGTVASIGRAAGAVEQNAVDEIQKQRSLIFLRPSVIAYVSDIERYHRAVTAVLKAMREGVVATIGATYPLDQARVAQRDLEEGHSTGSLLLIP